MGLQVINSQDKMVANRFLRRSRRKLRYFAFLFLLIGVLCQSTNAENESATNKQAKPRSQRKLKSSSKGARTTTPKTVTTTAAATVQAPNFVTEDFSRYVDATGGTVVIDFSDVTSLNFSNVTISDEDNSSPSLELKTSKTVERDASNYAYYNKLHPDHQHHPHPGVWHPVQPVIVPHQPHPPIVVHPATTTPAPSNLFHYTIKYEVNTTCHYHATIMLHEVWGNNLIVKVFLVHKK